MTSARPPNAASGRPPPAILPKIVRSGITPYRSWAPPRAIRKPVITSSKTSNAPDASLSCRRPSRNPGAGGTTPTFPATGSTMMQANPSPYWATARSEEHTSELQSHRDLHSFPTRRSSDLPQALEESGRRGHDAHVPGDGLDDDAGQPLAVLGHRCRSRVQFVVGADDRVGGDLGGHSRRRGDRQGCDPRARLRQQRVDVAVVAAGELQHAVAVRRATCEPDRAHRRLRARRDQAHHLDRRHGVHDLLGEQDLALGRRAEAGTSHGRLAHGVDRLRIGVPEDQGAPRADPVEEPPSVLRLDVGALGPADEEGLVEADRPHRADGRVDPAWDHALRSAPELGPRPYSHWASSFAQYETITSAPARLIAVSDSTAAARSSIHPAAPAALIIAYSPETLYAAIGRSNRSRTARITSRFGSAGLTINRSAPSARSSSHSRNASRTFAGSIW